MLLLCSTRSPLHVLVEVQYALEPPMRFTMVEFFWCPGALALHVPETWLHPPCVQHYLLVALRRKLALSGVFLGIIFPPRLFPWLMLHVVPVVIDCEICCKIFSISNWTGSDCTALAWCDDGCVTPEPSSDSSSGGATDMLSTALLRRDTSYVSQCLMLVLICWARFFAWW